MNLNNINRVKDTIAYKQDNIFIVCASFEERTKAIVEKLTTEIKLDAAFIFKFNEKNLTNLREKNFIRQKEILAKHAKYVCPILCDHHNPTDGIKNFRKILADLKIGLNNKKVILDISTFTKQYLFLILKFLDSFKLSQLRIFYTEPFKYAIKDQPLSFGYIDTVSVPSFGGHIDILKPNLLIVFLGYEGERALALWERFAPHKTIVLIGRPKSEKKWDGRVEKFNKKLINKISSKEKRYISSDNPFKIKQTINKLINRNSSKFNISISVLGPKPQAVGCFLAVKNNPNVQLLYSIPKYHNEIYFSESISTIWEYY